MDGAEGAVCSVLWERSGRAGSDGKIRRWCPPETTPELLWLSPPRGAGASQCWAWPSHPQPASHGVAMVLFFQFCQHPRETGGGPGVKGNIPPAWLRLGGGHPQLCMAWGGKLRLAVCMALAGSAQLCLAWLEWRGRGLMGRGWHGTFPWLEELTFCDSKAQKML